MSEQTTSNVYRIELLQGADHYPVWKVKMTDILTDQGLWDYVDGSIPAPPDSLATYPAWKKKDRAALTSIQLRVADKMLVYVQSAASLGEAWNSLRDMLEAQGALGIVLAWRKLFRSQYAEGMRGEEHIRILHSYQEELHNLGQQIDGAEFSIILLTLLPESWDNYIASVDTTTLGDAARLIARIMEHDQRLGISGNKDDTALAGKSNQKKKINPNIECFKCGKKGHIRAKCRSKSDDKDTNKGKDKAHEAKDDYSFVGGDVILSTTPDAWLADSGCTLHIARDRDIFFEYQSTPGHRITGFGGVDGLGRGSIRLQCVVGGEKQVQVLTDIVHAPDAPHNLISISRALKAKSQVLFADGRVRIRSPLKTIVMEGHVHGRLFNMNVEPIRNDRAHVAKGGCTWEEWHKALGHLNYESVKMLSEKGMVRGMDVLKGSPVGTECKACVIAKQHIRSFPKESKTEVGNIGDLTVSDLWGPAHTAALGGDVYFISFTDVKSR